MRGVVAFAFALVACGSSAAAGDDVASTWPPTGPTWETEPTRAFEKARDQKKPVFVYVATDG